MTALKELQKDYVKLLIHEGVNLQPGQRLVITCPVEEAWFARLCAAEAYDAAQRRANHASPTGQVMTSRCPGCRLTPSWISNFT